MTRIDFTKMEGLGNDFVVFEGPLAFAAGEVARLCDRRRGVGADGVLVVTDADPVRMEYWNADGSEAEMCGNGLRCVARFALLRGMATGDAFDVVTPAGSRRVEMRDEAVRVELGPITFEGAVDFDDNRLQLVTVGNPHAVIEVGDTKLAPVASLGPQIEQDSRFPGGINVEFMTVKEGEVAIRVWERGVGETQACGTGMAAAAAVAAESYGLEGRIPVETPGGWGEVEIVNGVAWLSGPAEVAFTGIWEISAPASSH